VERRLSRPTAVSSEYVPEKTRESVYKAIRDDLAPLPASPRKTRERGSGAAPENILQLLPDAAAASKEELAAYWRKVAKQALPYLARRPLNLARQAAGMTFYHFLSQRQAAARAKQRSPATH
jgi:hypothetical protein